MGVTITHWQAVLVILMATTTTMVISFNIDTKSLVVQQGPRGSCGEDDCMFGFSVAQHKEGGVPW